MGLLLQHRLAGPGPQVALMRRGRKERRTHEHAYPTVGALYDHFGNVLPRDAMVTAVRDAISAFIPREGTNLEEMRLQLVSKCESSLKRLAETGELRVMS